ncbi:spore coat putative kinase YutH [Anoxybacteroides tepidamans]|uniref:spore coat putative kinase YutH n=1 Tax=Anoxybacteroides tepidamans TaxID=265948 RepID=UPI0004831D93|nr:spore coat protein YutH [Anoxybacillus tepidamans]
MHDLIEREYGLKVERMEQLSRYYTFISRNERYIIVPAWNRTEAEMNELQQMGAYLAAKGDLSVASFVQTKKGTWIAVDQGGQHFTILRIYPHLYRRTIPIGKELAKLHERGRLFPARVFHSKRIGLWKELWGQRVDQMDSFWKEKLKMKRETEFEQLFVESFPYYAGLAENAIQYVVDTELDEQPYGVDAATICHERLSRTLWAEGTEIKLPTDWVYDHCARDLAEWVRSIYLKDGWLEEPINHFFREYERVTPLSAFAWRLVYARLLFPIHYFECIEGYYSTKIEEEKRSYEQRLKVMLENTHDYERFLASFYDQFGLSRRFRLPRVKWLREA